MIKNYSDYIAVKNHNKKIENEDKSGEQYYKYLTSYGQPTYQNTSANYNTMMTDSGGGNTAPKSTTPTTLTAPATPTTPSAPVTPSSTYNTTAPTNPYNPGTPGWSAWNQANGTSGAITTPATPAATSAQAATTPTANNYAQYLLRPMSAADYYKQTGIDTEQTYDKAIRQSETDYLKSQATYGQKAEQLGQAGLSGSGYGDYINGVGFASMQNSKVAASEQKAVNDISAMNAYGQYVAGVGQSNAQIIAQKTAEDAQKKAEADKATQTEQSYKDTIVQMAATGMSYDDVKKYIMDYYKLDDATATSYMANMYQLGADQYAKTQTQTTQQTTDEANAAATEAQLKFNQTALEYAASYDGNTIRQLLKTLGATPDQIETAMQGVSGTTAASLSNRIASITDVTQVPTTAQINALKGTVSDDEIATLIKSARDKRAALLMAKWESVDDTTSTQFFSDLDALHNSGDIADDKYKEFYLKRVDANIESAKSSSEPIAAIADVINTIKGMSGNIGTQLTNELIDYISNKMDVSHKTGATARMNGAGSANVSVSIGWATSEVKLNLSGKVDLPIGGNEADPIKYYNGKLYYYTGTGLGWTEITGINEKDAGGSELAGVIYNILLSKYKAQPNTTGASNNTSGFNPNQNMANPNWPTLKK